MIERVIFLPQATEDIDEAAFAIGLDSPQAALRFQVVARSTCLELGDMPNKGRIVELPSGPLRRWRVQDFENYLIFYRVFDDRIEIVRVLHGARDIEAALDET